MSDDLIKRLRASACLALSEANIFAEAADEIERLRESCHHGENRLRDQVSLTHFALREVAHLKRVNTFFAACGGDTIKRATNE